MGSDCRFLFQGLKSVLECVLKKYILVFEISFMPTVSFDQTHPLPPNNSQICVCENLNQEWQKISMTMHSKAVEVGSVAFWRVCPISTEVPPTVAVGT